MKILILDNYDSFTYNLVHLIEKIIDLEVAVFRNDEIALEQVDMYDKIVLSPGPGLPKDAGIMPDLIQRYASSKSILGVCLGHQAIAEAFSGKLRNLDTVFHGVSTPIKVLKNNILFQNIPSTFSIGRYHSWIVDKDQLPDSLEISAIDTSGHIMAIDHKTFDIKGVQFHPESVLTEYGEQLLKNWLLS